MQETVQQRRSGHVLVVDDIPANILLLTKMLRATGYTIQAANNGIQALEAAQTDPPDVILLDIMMPQMNGFEVCVELKADPKLAHIPVIFISALNDADQIAQGFEVGAVDYIARPFNANEVVMRVKNHLQLSQLQQELRQHNADLTAEIEERRRIELRLRQLSQAVEQSPVSVVMTDPNGCIEYVNPKFIQITGYTQAEILGQNARVLKSGQAPAETFAKLWQTITTGLVWQGELLNKKKNGDFFWEETRISPIFNADGHIINYVAVKEDVTEKKQTERALQESEARYRLMVENQAEGISEVDINEQFTFANPAAERFFGVSSGQLVGRNLREFIPPEEFIRVQQQTALRQKGETGSYDLLIIRPDGKTLYLLVTATPKMDEHGRYSGTLGIFRDVTDRKLAEEALRESEQRFKGAFQSSPIGMALVSPDGTWLQVNSRVSSIVGYSQDELMTRTFQEITHPDDLAIDLRYVRQMLSGEIETYSLEKRYIHKEGRIVQVLLTVALVKDRVGAPLYFISQIEDITERKQAEEALRESEEKFRILYESSRDAIMTLEPPDWRFTSGNPATIAMFQVKDEAAFTSAGPWNLSPDYQPDGRASGEKARAMIDQAIQARFNFFEWTHKRINGEEFPATVLLTPFEWKGRTILQATVRDITIQKQANAELRRSEEKLRSFMDSATDGFTLFDADLRVIDINDEALKLERLTREQVIGRTMQELDPQPEKSGRLAHYQEVIRTGEPFITEAVSFDSLCTEVHFHIKAFKVGDGLGIISTDITERKKLEARLQENIGFLETLLDTFPTPIFFKDRQGRYQGCNHAFEVMLGRARADIVGKNVYDLAPKPLADKYFEMDEALFNQPGIQVYEAPATFADGQTHEVIFHKAVYYDNHRKIAGLVGVIVDITARKKSEDRLRKYERMVAAIPDFLSLVTPEGKYEIINDAYVKSMLKPVEEINGQLMHDVWGDEMFTRYMKPCLERCLQGEAQSYEAWFNFVNRPPTYMNVNYSPYYDTNQQIAGVVISARDITRLKVVEEAQRESREELSLTQTYAKIGSWQFDMETQQIRLSAEHQKMLGLPAQEEEFPLFDFAEKYFFPADIAPLRERLKNAQQNRDNPDYFDTFEYRAYVADGTLRNFQVWSRFRTSGQLHGATQDITDRKKAEESRYLLQQAIEALNLGLTISAPDGKITYCNPADAAMHGYTVEELMGQNVRVFSPLGYEFRPDSDTIRKSQQFRRETINTRKDGGAFPVQLMSTPIYNTDGEFVGTTTTCEDISERKAAEEALAHSQANMQAILNNSLQAFVLLDRHARIRAFNRLADLESLAIFGMPLTEGRPFRKYLRPDDDEIFLHHFARAMTGEVSIRERQAITQDRGTLWFELNYVPVYKSSGEVDGVCFSSLDITERKRSELALGRSEAFLDSIIENIPDMIFVKDAQQLCFIRFNKAGEELLGLSRTEMIGKNDHDFFPPDQADFFTTNDRKVLQGGQTAHIAEEPIQTKYHGQRFLQTKKIPILDELGQPLYLLGISEDITERKKIAQALEHQTEYLAALHQIALDLLNRRDLNDVLQTILDNAATLLQTDYGLFVLPDSNGGDWLNINVTTAKSAGVKGGRIRPGEGLSGHAFLTREPILIDNYQTWENAIPRYAALGIRSVLSLPIMIEQTCKGVLTLWRTLEQPSFQPEQLYEAKNFSQLAALVLDNAQLYERLQKELSEREKRAEELQQARDAAEAANRAKSDFLANMSHELRTPLNGILGYTQILQQDEKLNTRQLDAIRTIQRSGEHLLTLINDILDLSKVEAGKLELSVSMIDLPDMLRDVVEMVQIRATQKGLIFSHRFSPNLPSTVMCDEKRLRQILLNLLGNAVKYTISGSVNFLVTHQDSKFRFEIADTGPGISAEHLEKIFNPFYQIRDKARIADGTGLGLSIARRLSLMMGGDLVVESTPGIGSVFRFELLLPIVHHTKISSKSPAPTQPIKGYLGVRRRILLVDDKPDNRHILHEMLAPLDFVLAEAEDGLQARQLVDEFKPDLILLDLIMPRMDGFEFLRHLRSRPDLVQPKVICISASAFDAVKQKTLDAGGDDFIAKPFRREILLDCLQIQLKLEWRQPLEKTPGAESAGEPLVWPDDILLRGLYDVAFMGDLDKMESWFTKTENEYPQYATFIQKTRRMAEDFEIEALCELLEKRLGE